MAPTGGTGGGGSGGTVTIQKLQADVTANTTDYDVKLAKVQTTGQQAAQSQVGQQQQVTKATEGSSASMAGLMAAVMSLAYIIKENSGAAGAAWDVFSASVGIAVDEWVESMSTAQTDIPASADAIGKSMKDVAKDIADTGKATKKSSEEMGDSCDDMEDSFISLQPPIIGSMDPLTGLINALHAWGITASDIVPGIITLSEGFHSLGDSIGDMGGTVNKWSGDTQMEIRNWSTNTYNSINEWGNQQAGNFNKWAADTGGVINKWAGDTGATLHDWAGSVDWSKMGADITKAFSGVDWGGIEKSIGGMAKNLTDFWNGVTKANQKTAQDAMDKLKGWLSSL